jgi:tetratricopeptide (TPR) repeat protein
MPKPVVRPGPPKEIKTNEELYLTGLRIEQLYSPSYDPVPYYQEALRRDLGDYRANVALGALLCRQGQFAEAEPLLRAAEARATDNYIRPNTCEASYYLGVVLRAQDRLAEAEKAFWRSIWDRNWQAPGYLALAEMSSGQARFEPALNLVNQSIHAGGLNTRALELKTALLRRLGRAGEARRWATRVLQIDPLNHRALCEQALLRGGLPGNGAKLHQMMRSEPAAYLELAVDYAGAGLYPEAAEVLREGINACGRTRANYQLLHYYLGYYEAKRGDSRAAGVALETASTLPADFGFPFQQEAEPILMHAMSANPEDPMAPYYLGNLLYDHQPQRALELWQQAVQLDPRFALAHRNVGLALGQAKQDLAGAIRSMENAVELKPGDSRTIYELDVLYEAAGVDVASRLERLEAHPVAVRQRDDTTTRWLNLLLVSGRAREAREVLVSRQFHNWEGSSALHDVHVDACLQLGREYLLAGQPEDALQCFSQASEYPVNQQVGKSRRENRLPEIGWHRGLALARLGRQDQAAEAFHEAGAAQRGSTELQFYRVLALRRAGQGVRAKELSSEIVKRAVAELEGGREEMDYFAKFGERRAARLQKADRYFAAALAYVGAGRTSEAETWFEKALELHPAHLGARTWTNKKFREEFFERGPS